MWCGGLRQVVTFGKTWKLLWSNHIFIYYILRCQNFSLRLQRRLSNAAFMGERVKGGLTLMLLLWSLFLTVWSGRGHPAGCNFVWLLVVFTKRSTMWSSCRYSDRNGSCLVVASPTDAVWFPKQVKYIHNGLCFLKGTNGEVYLILSFIVMMEWSIITLLFFSRVCVACFVHRIF